MGAVALIGLFEAATGLTVGLLSREDAADTTFLGLDGGLAIETYGRPVIAATGLVALVATASAILLLFRRRQSGRFQATAVLGLGTADLWHDVQWSENGAYLALLIPVAALLLLWTARFGTALHRAEFHPAVQRLAAWVLFTGLAGMFIAMEPWLMSHIEGMDWIAAHYEPVRTHFALDRIVGIALIVAAFLLAAGVRMASRNPRYQRH